MELYATRSAMSAVVSQDNRVSFAHPAYKPYKSYFEYSSTPTYQVALFCPCRGNGAAKYFAFFKRGWWYGGRDTSVPTFGFFP